MWMEVLIADELDIRLTVQIARIFGGWSGGFHDEYAGFGAWMRMLVVVGVVDLSLMERLGLRERGEKEVRTEI